MTAAYRASFEDARKSLATLRALPGHRFLVDDVDAAALPVLTNYRQTTDAHLLILAKKHGLKLATLDATLIAQSWATGTAANPFTGSWKSENNFMTFVECSRCCLTSSFWLLISDLWLLTSDAEILNLSAFD
jgi:DNA-binding SARP family transcriptional activator